MDIQKLEEIRLIVESVDCPKCDKSKLSLICVIDEWVAEVYCRHCKNEAVVKIREE